MKKADRVERNLYIKLMDMRGASKREIGETHNLSVKQVGRVLDAWNESPFRLDTEGAYEAVTRTLELVRDDMEALGIKAAQASPMESLLILGRRADLIMKNLDALADVGVSFAGVLDHAHAGPITDIDVIPAVNGAIREVLVEHGVERIVIEMALNAGLNKYADWGAPVPRAEQDWEEMSERLARVEAGHNSQ